MRMNTESAGRVIVCLQYSMAGEVFVPPPSWVPKMTSTGSDSSGVRSVTAVS